MFLGEPKKVYKWERILLLSRDAEKTSRHELNCIWYFAVDHWSGLQPHAQKARLVEAESECFVELLDGPGCRVEPGIVIGYHRFFVNTMERFIAGALILLPFILNFDGVVWLLDRLCLV